MLVVVVVAVFVCLLLLLFVCLLVCLFFVSCFVSVFTPAASVHILCYHPQLYFSQLFFCDNTPVELGRIYAKRYISTMLEPTV